MCTLKQIEMVERHSTQKSWAVPESLIQMVDDKKFLAAQAHAYGLCNLLSAGGAGRQPSLKDSKGLTQLLAIRTVFGIQNMIQYYCNCKFIDIRMFTCKSEVLSCMQVDSHDHYRQAP